MTSLSMTSPFFIPSGINCCEIDALQNRRQLASDLVLFVPAERVDNICQCSCRADSSAAAPTARCLTSAAVNADRKWSLAAHFPDHNQYVRTSQCCITAARPQTNCILADFCVIRAFLLCLCKYSMGPSIVRHDSDNFVTDIEQALQV